jgi:hypothetical protein
MGPQFVADTGLQFRLCYYSRAVYREVQRGGFSSYLDD